MKFKTLDIFEGRTQEIVSYYEQLKEKKSKLEADLAELKRNPSVDLSAQDLLMGNYGPKNNKITELENEIAVIDDFIMNAVRLSQAKRTSELAIVCRTDKELESLAADLMNDLEKEFKQAEKKKATLEKRTNEAVAEITAIVKERDEMIKELQLIENIQEKIRTRTNLEVSSSIHKYYKPENEPLYYKFKQIMNVLNS